MNCLKKTTVIRTTVPISKFSKEPKSGAPTPPAKLLIPTGNSERPIESTTTPVTIGGKNFLTLLIISPRSPSKIPPIKAAPKTPSKPYLVPIEIATGTKAKLVPTTIGNLAPIGPIV